MAADAEFIEVTVRREFFGMETGER